MSDTEAPILSMLGTLHRAEWDDAAGCWYAAACDSRMYRDYAGSIEHRRDCAGCYPASPETRTTP